MKWPHTYHPTHGPQVWPWWRLFAVKCVRCTFDPPDYFWMTPVAYNLWIYTRFGAWCFNITERRGVRRGDGGR